MESSHSNGNTLPPILLTIGSLAWKGVAWWSNIDFLLSIRDEKFLVMFKFLSEYGHMALSCGGRRLVARSQTPASQELE